MQRHAPLLLLLLGSVSFACVGTIGEDPIPRIDAEGRPAARFGANIIEIFDADGLRIARIEAARTIDNVLDFDDTRVLYKMATATGLPDGQVHIALLDGTEEPDPTLGLRVRSARIHADGRTVALSSWEHDLYLWDLETGTLTGPILSDVPTAGVHFEPGGTTRLLVNREVGWEDSKVDAILYDTATGVLTPLPTGGRAYVARWSGPGTIVYGTFSAAATVYEMDVATFVESTVAASIHADAMDLATNVRPGLPPRGDLVTTALTVADLGLRLPFDNGEYRLIWQAYDGDPGNSLTTHIGLNQYAIDFAVACSNGGGYGTPILSVADGVVVSANGSTANGCSDPVACSGCGGGGGLMVIVTHLGDFESTYMHNSVAHVGGNDDACQGRHLSDMGNSGYSCGSCAPYEGTHLHLRLLNADGAPVLMEPISGYTGITVSDGGLTSDNSLLTSCGSGPPPPPPPPPPGPMCGNMACESGEDCSNCAGDCGSCPPPPGVVCGNMVCETGEDCTNCSMDCGSCPPPPPSCPSGDGQYCGGTVGMDPNTLYDCVGGSFSVNEMCGNGCHISAPGTADYCEPPPGGCPSGDGLYCGSTLGLNANTLYYCAGGSNSFDQWCAAGCHIAPPGSPDYCDPGSCPSGDGWYCGSGSLDPDIVYYCASGAWSISQSCPGTCIVAPPGNPDYCG